MITGEHEAGHGQVIVTYISDDTGGEVDAAAVAEEIAADAQQRAAAGLKIVAMAGMPLRHAAVAFGREGSGYNTKEAVLVTFGPA
jgi:hypothetical protein